MSKPMQMWACFDPYGRIVEGSVRETDQQSRDVAMEFNGTNWWNLHEQGYTVRRVEVREVENAD